MVDRKHGNADRDWIIGVVHILNYGRGELAAILPLAKGRGAQKRAWELEKGACLYPISREGGNRHRCILGPCGFRALNRRWEAGGKAIPAHRAPSGG